MSLSLFISAAILDLESYECPWTFFFSEGGTAEKVAYGRGEVIRWKITQRYSSFSSDFHLETVGAKVNEPILTLVYTCFNGRWERTPPIVPSVAFESRMSKTRKGLFCQDCQYK